MRIWESITTGWCRGPPYGHITTENNIVVNTTGWGFVNPWNGNSSYFVHGYNLTFNDHIDYGNYPANNNAPTATDIGGQDPLFVSTTPGALNFHLQTASPAIGSGNYVGLPFLGTAPTLGAFDPLLIISQPPNQALTGGTPAFLSATVTGVQPYSLQWYRNGVPLAGATSSA